jgi:beta-galactosidase
MRFPLRTPWWLLLSGFAALVPTAVRGQQTGTPSQNLVTVDASATIAPPEMGYLHMGGRSVTGHTLQVNSRYLVLDGKPWLPVMGEMHYSRVPEAEWEDEILKMKAAGINIVATYIFWIHHEEIEGTFDWNGRRDLRHFVQLCAKHGMYVWLRPGPWDHGEVRNGGFPDWIAKLPNTRTNDPVYLHYVDRFFGQIGMQVKGLMFKDGGPIIGAQIENEYGLHGPGRGAEHILKLKQIAEAAGIDPPLFSVTGWPSLDFPPQEVIPVSGGYPDGFWYGSQTEIPPSVTYLFNFNRELGDMGATVASQDLSGKVDLKHDPYFAAEQAGGMASSYHRRPVDSADDIAALALTGIGSGINLYGYYMFHGGVNPVGKLSTLQESQATGYPNDLPELDYDFGAPLGAFGQERASYRKTRLLHSFLNAYGAELAPMPAFAPTVHSRDPANTETPRVAVRTGGDLGFIFVNNYVRQLQMPARPGFQVHVQLQRRSIAVPRAPVNVPAGAYFVWPFDLKLNQARLDYSTAQLFTRIETPVKKLVLFFAVPGIAPEFVFDAATTSKVVAPHAHVVSAQGTITVSNLEPGMDCTVEVTDRSGAKTTLLLLTRQQAEESTVIRIGNGDHIAMTGSTLLFDGRQILLRSTSSPVQRLALLPGLRTDKPGQKAQGMWSIYTREQPERHLELTALETRPAAPRARMDMGSFVDWRKGTVPTVPPSASFDQAETWKLSWNKPDMTGLSEVLLQIDYAGDIGRLYSSTKLLDDNFFNGVTWQVGLKRFGSETYTTPLTLKLLPMPVVAPLYLEEQARQKLTAAKGKELIRATLIPEYEAAIAVPQ